MKILENFLVTLVAKSLSTNQRWPNIFLQFIKRRWNTSVTHVTECLLELTITKSTWGPCMRGSNHMNVNIVNVPMLKWVICIVMLEKHIMLNPIKFEVKKDVKINMKCDTCSKKKLSSIYSLMKFQLSMILKTLLATLIYITKTRISATRVSSLTIIGIAT